MDSFYDNLLNIGKKTLEEKVYQELLKKIVKEEKEEYETKYENLDRLCKFMANNINYKLKNENIDSKIINTKHIYDMYEHEFVMSSIVVDKNINYYLIDPTYSQFMDKGKFGPNMIYPVDILNSSTEGRILLDNLLKYGYSKVDDNDIKRYFGSLMYESDINKIDVTISDLILERSKR